MRFSSKNVHSGGAQSNQPPSSQRAQTIERIDFSFPKSARVLRNKHYKEIARERNRFVGRSIVIDYRLRSDNLVKLGLTVPRQAGAAVWRNRFKRLVREVFRQNQHHIIVGVDMNVSPKKGVGLSSLEAICNDLMDFNNHELPKFRTAKSC